MKAPNKPGRRSGAVKGQHHFVALAVLLPDDLGINAGREVEQTDKALKRTADAAA